MRNHIDSSWRINAYCNYDCDYCFSRSIDKKKLYRGDPDIQKLIDSFNRTGLSWFILITGGEPFFQPSFVELCQGLTQNHTIALNTNLSHRKSFDFADTIDPQRVRWIDCSIHIMELERLNQVDGFIEKFKYLQEKGFPIYANYVMYPPYLKRFEKDYRFFKSHGIILWPKLFKGPYTPVKIPSKRGILRKGSRALEILFAKDYPDAFIKAQKEQILFFMDRSQKEAESQGLGAKPGTKDDLPKLWHDRKVLAGVPSFIGQLCGAGKNFVHITETGDIIRCHSIWKSMGNLYRGDFKLNMDFKACEANNCICPYEGFNNLKERL